MTANGPTAALLALLMAIAGCLAAATPSEAPGKACDTPAAQNGNIDCSDWFPACEHPWPCADGSEWPDELIGQTFNLSRVETYNVTRPDNVTLRGWIGMPDVPEGTRVPVLLAVHSSFPFCNFRLDTILLGPAAGLYPGTCLPTPASPEYWTDPPHYFALEPWGIPPLALVKQGYAVALFSQRGTGNSTGCYDVLGLVQNGDEQAIIEALANEPWSNGRVGIGGVSAPAGPAMVGATSGAPALKTIVVAGTLIDAYTFFYTPQGAGSMYALQAGSWGQTASQSLMPPLVDINGATDDPEAFARAYPQRVERFEERASCSETIEWITLAQGALKDDRNPEFWERHRLIDDLDQVTASLLVAQGFQDRYPHAFQDTYLSSLVSSPMRQIKGQWTHGWPITEHQPGRDVMVNGNTAWNDTLVPWLDFWLKGLGPKPEGLERVDYQETGGSWRWSTSWPPAQTREEVVHLADESLSASPGTRARSFQSIPVTGNNAGFAEQLAVAMNTWPAACPTNQLVSPNALVYATAPLEEPLVLAGNPFAYLNISSNLPGGIVSIDVWEAPPDYQCTDVGEQPKIHMVSSGSADLRFHEGNLDGTDFDVNTPTKVRVDLYDIGETVEAGNRLFVILSYGEDVMPSSRMSQPLYPTITVHEDSHLVLPFIEGTLGGDAPTIDYPARPFMPGWQAPAPAADGGALSPAEELIPSPPIPCVGLTCG